MNIDAFWEKHTYYAHTPSGDGLSIITMRVNMCRLPDSNRAKNSAKASSLLDTSINPLKTLGIFMWSTD